VTRLVEVPTQFDDRSFDQFASAFAEAAKDGERLLFDAHATEWASPYGLVGLLAAGQAAQGTGRASGGSGERPLLTAPTHADVLTYWTRAGFFREAAELFEIHGKVPRVKPAGESDVLLPVTPVRAAEDVHAVVSNIHWRRKLAKRVVVIAVADAGVGFRHSLEPTQSKRFGTRWGDAAALEAALIQGVSRFRDPGRGQGLAGIRRYLTRWDGKIAIRSGTARIAIVPKWDDDVPLKDGLPAFPGAQVLIIIPEQGSTKP